MGYHCLIVDDSKVTRGIIAKALRLSGIPLGDIHQAANGQEALKIVGANPIHLILADLNMPVMDGVTMIETLAKKHLVPAIPVVVVTSDRNAETHRHLRDRGVRAFLSKPFTPERIRAVALEILEETGPDSTSPAAPEGRRNERAS